MTPLAVLVAGLGAPWEPEALTALRGPGLALLKRCVDVEDLLGAAAVGQADAAVVGLDAPGLDADAVRLLAEHGLRVVAVAPRGATPDAVAARAGRLGVGVLAEAEIGRLGQALMSAPVAGSAAPAVDDPAPAIDVPAPVGAGAEPGRVTAVWGPVGAPGRTTVAVALADLVARGGHPVTLVDADPYGGAVAQHLGVLDEASGLLSAARAPAGSDLIAWCSRDLGPAGAGADRLVVTGLPRAERWVELRPSVLEAVLDAAAARGHVVVDTGAVLEEEAPADLGLRPGRNALTLTALAAADDVVVVGTADPVGLTRLARGLSQLAEHTDVEPVVVLNRMRPTLGWSAAEVSALLREATGRVPTAYLPDDQAALDRALVAGRSPVEQGEGAFVAALAPVAARLAPPRGGVTARRGGGLRRRTAGTGRRR